MMHVLESVTSSVVQWRQPMDGIFLLEEWPCLWVLACLASSLSSHILWSWRRLPAATATATVIARRWRLLLECWSSATWSASSPSTSLSGFLSMRSSLHSSPSSSTPGTGSSTLSMSLSTSSTLLPAERQSDYSSKISKTFLIWRNRSHCMKIEKCQAIKIPKKWEYIHLSEWFPLEIFYVLHQNIMKLKCIAKLYNFNICCVINKIWGEYCA